LDDVPISSIMTREIAAVSPDCPIRELLESLRGRRSGCAVVCEDGLPVGIVTLRDLTQLLEDALRGADPGALTAMDVMAFPPFTLRESESMSDAMALVQERGFAQVPVVDGGGALVGMVEQSDLLRAHSRALDEKSESLQRLVAERTRELVRANERLQQLSLEDPLTGIGNRRAMHASLEEIHEVARRFGTPYSVVMIDIDHFKAYNDLCGHPRGDEVLRSVAEALRAGLRQVDQLYRYGGEELLAVLPQTGLEGALQAAERFRACVEGRGIPHAGSPHESVTVSAGVASVFAERGLVPEWSQVVDLADRALYRAKQAGRNRVSA
jgi:diguanylate cyclase (GGDEF)-like protein